MGACRACPQSPRHPGKTKKKKAVELHGGIGKSGSSSSSLYVPYCTSEILDNVT